MGKCCCPQLYSVGFYSIAGKSSPISETRCGQRPQKRASWQSVKVMDSFIRKGFYTIGALKTNRIIYPCGIHQKVSEFALHLRKTDRNVSLVTVGSREFYVYCYEGALNDIPNAAVIISYPREAFGNPKALRVFISTNTGISAHKILEIYTKRWPIELFSARVRINLG